MDKLHEHELLRARVIVFAGLLGAMVFAGLFNTNAEENRQPSARGAETSKDMVSSLERFGTEQTAEGTTYFFPCHSTDESVIDIVSSGRNIKVVARTIYNNTGSVSFAISQPQAGVYRIGPETEDIEVTHRELVRSPAGVRQAINVDPDTVFLARLFVPKEQAIAETSVASLELTCLQRQEYIPPALQDNRPKQS